MNSLPNDNFILILRLLAISDVYTLKKVNNGLLQQVGACQKDTTYLPETFWGVNVRNINLIGRDYSLNYQPTFLGLMTCKIFSQFYRYFKPPSFTINGFTSTLNLTKHLLKNNLGIDLVVYVNQKNLMTVNKTKVSIDAENLTIYSEDKITIEISMQLLNLRNQRVKNLKIHGEVNDMQFVFYMLPKCLQSLEIYSKIGVHDVRSLPYFLELQLKYLNLFQCYEVCSHIDCVNYNSINSQIRKCSKFPTSIAMSPFPFDAIKFCEKNGVAVDFANSYFFDFEFDDVMKHINAK
tara:strand:- start:50 stop:928 length:879 start_codon:yes stop_codon:yes gene_type:complete